MLVHKESKSLILKLRDPSRVTAHIPKTRVVKHEGMDLTQVFFGLDEARVLRNLGIAAPSPVRYFYDYPLRPPFKPFDHQVTTAEFFTLNSRAICLNDMGCVDAATEYLSPTGWVRMDQYAGGQVAQWLPSEQRYEFVMPTEYVKKPCSSMLRWRSPYTDQKLSVEHRVLLYRADGSSVVYRADELVGYAERGLFLHDGDKLVPAFTDGGWSIRHEDNPDGFKYCFMVPSTFLLLRRNGCVFATGNTGKTLSSLWAADFLMRQRVVQKAIVVCPKSTMSSVWENEVTTHFLGRMGVAVLSGSKERRLKQLKRTDVSLYVINHDGLKVIEKELAQRRDINLWIIDEAAKFRNAQSKRHQLLASLVRPTDWMWLMTGTPCPQDPTDAWGLAKLMHGSRVQPKFYTHFRNQTMTQITQYKWVPKPDAFAKVLALLQPGIRFAKEACIDLPPVTFQTRMSSLSPDQVAAYRAMITHLVANVKGVDISAANAAVKMFKLLQVCVGSIYDEHGNGYDIDSSDRLATCEEIVEEAGHKVIIFVPFTYALDKVANHLRKRWTVETVDGRTSDGARKRIFHDFQNSDDPRILVAHPETTAHGLTLTRADTTIWYAPITSLEIFEQANNRMNRPGQKNKMTIAMIAATMLEQNLYQALKNKQDVQNSVLKLFKDELGLD